jgi:hypothetical protein
MARPSQKTTAEIYAEALQRLEDSAVRCEAILSTLRKTIRALKKSSIAAPETPKPAA